MFPEVQLPTVLNANFSVKLPNAPLTMQVVFTSTKLGDSFAVGNTAFADSITHASILSTPDDGPNFATRHATGTAYGSTSEDYSVYKGFKIAFTRALEDFINHGVDQAVDELIKQQDALQLPTTVDQIHQEALRIRHLGKQFRAFMWQAFHKVFPNPETV